jgi:hypothetical protein
MWWLLHQLIVAYINFALTKMQVKTGIEQGSIRQSVCQFATDFSGFWLT